MVVHTLNPSTGSRGRWISFSFQVSLSYIENSRVVRVMSVSKASKKTNKQKRIQ